MSNDNAFRELKFSPGQLVIVFLAILVLGISVFLLGISVGKKQTQIQAQAGPASVESALKAENVSPPIKVGEYVTTTAPAETKVDPGAAAATETKTAEKTDPNSRQPVTRSVRYFGDAGPTGVKPAETKPAESKPAEAKDEPKPAAAEPKPKTPPAPAYKGAPYYVQIGAVEARPAADAFAKKVTGLGFPTLVLDPFPTDKKPVFRIRVGPYPSKDEASDAQTKLAAELDKKKTDFFLVKG